MHREKKQACMLHTHLRKSKTSFKGNLPTEYEWITQSNCSTLGKKQGKGSLLHNLRSQKKSCIVRYIHAKATYQLSTSELQRSAASWEKKESNMITLTSEVSYELSFKGIANLHSEYEWISPDVCSRLERTDIISLISVINSEYSYIRSRGTYTYLLWITPDKCSKLGKKQSMS